MHASHALSTVCAVNAAAAVDADARATLETADSCATRAFASSSNLLLHAWRSLTMHQCLVIVA